MTDIVLYSSRRNIDPSDELRAAVKATLDAFATQAPVDGGCTIMADADTPKGRVSVLLTFLPRAPQD